MYALHALWQADGRLALWAEDAQAFGVPAREVHPVGGSSALSAGAARAAGPERPVDPERRAPKGVRAAVHPYACPADALARLLGAIGPGLGWLAEQARERWATLLLPGFSATPTPSPQLPVGAVERGVTLSPWRVPVLLFEAPEAAQLLGELFDPYCSVAVAELPGTGPVEVAYGASVRWLTAVHDLAWRLVGRGRVLPVLRETRGGLHAHWQPAPDAAARREAEALAAGCPPVCRAECSPGARARTGTELLAELLDVLVDRETRVALEGAPPPLRRAPATVAEAWLAALHAADGLLAPVAPQAVPAVGLPGSLPGSDSASGSAPGPALGRSGAGADLGPGSGVGAGVGAGADSAKRAAADLTDRLAAWYAGTPAPDQALRLCFRLSEPLGHDADLPDAPGPSAVANQPAGDDDWRIDFLLQSVDQPSLLVTAEDLWSGGPAWAALSRQTDDPVGSYAAELDRAVLRRPELRRALRISRPTGLALDRAEALDFLREAAPALAEAGFGVLLPAWWQRRPRLGLVLKAARTPVAGALERTGRIDRDAVMDFRWSVAIGELSLTEKELAELGAAQQGLVRLRGRWIEVDAKQIEAALAFLAHQGAGVMSTTEVLRLALDPTVRVAGLPVARVEAVGPRGPGRGAERASPPMLPDGFGATLRPYQERGLAWLHSLARLGLGAVLADDMGLGKTVQTLALLAVEKAERSEPADRARQAGQAGPAEPALRAPGTATANLLVCPMSLVGNWQREAERFAPMLRVHVHHGAGRADGSVTQAVADGADLVITTYGLAQRDADELGRIAWRRVVVDEAQFIKNAATAQSRAVRSLKAEHRIALTGTPVENRLAELHAVLDFANPGLFGSAESFKERYAIPVELNANPAMTGQLRRLAGPFMLRRSKSDPAIAAELPAKQEITVWCNLTAEQAGLYQAVVADLLQRLGGVRGVERQGAVLSAIGRLKQVCNHPAQLLHDRSVLGDRSGKVARLEGILAEALAEGGRVLVFTQYAEFGRMLQPHLAARLGEEVLYLHGGVPKRRREEMVARFQSPDGPRVFLLSLKAGGTGLNLTNANHVVHLDRWWNPAVEDQATDRAFRIGQRRDVQVRRLVCVGTVEERIAELIESKRALAEAVVGEGEQWLGDLSAATLRELVSLSADAIGESDADGAIGAIGASEAVGRTTGGVIGR
ncbi:DEAD/DEAH box helicase [Saccharothrix sp. ST-888]|uniref:DEAD/DEAH box helicase n=1 Tax=Saccharothrix sp. ST-888 TaxID=1427391 RepID=UPI000696F487|nr:DEAD/DEAH box helicase [Saccharothrix sp. ST-888]